MAQAAITAQIHQALDRLLHFAPQIALDLEVLIEYLANPHLFVSRQIIAVAPWIYVRFLQNAVGDRIPNSVNIGERDFYPLVARQFNAGHTCH
jgi:hypothetical protein